MNKKITEEIIKHIYNVILSQIDNLLPIMVEFEDNIESPVFYGYLSLSKEDSPKIYIALLEIDNDIIIILKDDKNYQIVLSKIDNVYNIANYNSVKSFNLNLMQQAEFLFHFEKIINSGVSIYPSNNFNVIDVLNWALND